VLARVFGPPAHPAMLRQEPAQPPGRAMHPRLLLQIGRESLGGPDVAREAQSGGWQLQCRLHGRQIGGIRLHGAPGARRIGPRRHPTRGEARQPVGHGLDRTPAPARNPLDVIAQRRRFAHLQPLADPPPQIGALQLPLHHRALLCGEHHVWLTHALAPLLLPRTPAAPRLRVV
jgi:hypothetical protein